jgi:hypothetical protein
VASRDGFDPRTSPANNNRGAFNSTRASLTTSPALAAANEFRPSPPPRNQGAAARRRRVTGLPFRAILTERFAARGGWFWARWPAWFTERFPQLPD